MSKNLDKIKMMCYDIYDDDNNSEPNMSRGRLPLQRNWNTLPDLSGSVIQCPPRGYCTPATLLQKHGNGEGGSSQPSRWTTRTSWGERPDIKERRRHAKRGKRKYSFTCRNDQRRVLEAILNLPKSKSDWQAEGYCNQGCDKEAYRCPPT